MTGLYAISCSTASRALALIQHLYPGEDISVESSSCRTAFLWSDCMTDEVTELGSFSFGKLCVRVPLPSAF